MWGDRVRFVRDHNHSESYAVVSLVMGNDQHIDVENIRTGVYRDAVTGNEITVDRSYLSFILGAR